MSQPALQLPTTGTLGGLTMVQDINAALAALSSFLQGPVAPTASALGLDNLVGVGWHDTATSTLKIRDQADTAWIVIGTFDETNKVFRACAAYGDLTGKPTLGTAAAATLGTGAGQVPTADQISSLVGSTADLMARDQIALTNLRLTLNTSVSTGALIQGKQWELGTDEWATGSTGQSLISSSVSYYSGQSTVKQTFSYTGADQQSVVPAGAISAIVKLWGAGGGSTGQTVGSGNADFAGGAAFVSGTMAVTPGQSLTIVVGQGGSVSAGASYGGGGAGSSNGGSGGGRSAIRSNSADLVTAGGGGGAGNNVNNAQSGGVGGGATGGSGVAGGTGGTQSGGGTAGGGSGATNGSQYTGGAGSGGGGGGGGGYYGGGGGGNIPGSGGGGSSYVGTLSNVTNTQAASYVAAGTADADYVAGIGYGQQGSDVTSGNGRVVIIYTIAQNMTLVSPAVSLSAPPTYADCYLLWKDDSGSSVLGTDLTVELSRDAGGTWTAATISNLLGAGGFDGTYAVLRARANVSGQPNGTSLTCRIKTLNSKVQRVAAPALYAE